MPRKNLANVADRLRALGAVRSRIQRIEQMSGNDYINSSAELARLYRAEGVLNSPPGSTGYEQEIATLNAVGIHRSITESEE